MTSTRADLIIVGRVATLAGDSGFGWQSGIAIAGGEVIAVGAESELEALSGPATEHWRLPPEQVVMPSITDAHLHLMTLALAETQVDLTGLDLGATLAALVERDRELRVRGDTDGWLLGHGWAPHDLGGWPDAAQLDSIAPGRPVALHSHDHHSRWLSSAALAVVGIDSASTDPANGLIRRDDGGHPTGVLHEAVSAMVDPFVPDPPWSDLEQSIAAVAQRLLAMGVTGCHDPGELDADVSIKRGPRFYRAFAESGRLPLRVHSSVRARQLERASELGMRSGQSVGRFSVGWLKLFADGALGSRSAALLEPYSDASDNPPTGGPRGMALLGREELVELIVRANAMGIASQVHALGDGAVRMVLDAFEEVGADSARGLPLMARIEHAQLVDPTDQPRFGRLGVAASVQPVHLRSDAQQARMAWGERSENSFPLRGLLDGGALIPLGTDAPVEPPDPWPGIAVAIARREPSDPSSPALGAAHAISLSRAIRAAVLDPAIVAGSANLGRLLPGYRADLLVVPAQALADPVNPAELALTRPLATLLDGETVFRLI